MSRLNAVLLAVVFSLLVLNTANAANAAGYKAPYQLLANKEGNRVFVLNHESGDVAVLDAASGKVESTFPVGTELNGMVLSPDEKLLYVASGGDEGKISILNLSNGKVEKSVPGGHSPCGPCVSPDGKKLYVCNRFLDSIAEYELPSLKKTDRIFPAIREPRASAITPDGKTVFVINFLPNDPADSFDVASEVTAIDTASGTVKNIRLPNGSSSLHGICISPDGKYVFLTEILARYQMPTTQLDRGWMNTNGVSIIDANAKTFINTVLLDDVDLGAANPWGITISPDGKNLFVALSGTHEFCVVDVEEMMKKLEALPKTLEEAKTKGTYDSRGTQSSSIADDVPNDLAFLVGLKKRIKLRGNAPRGIAVAGGSVFAGMYFSDTVEKVDISSLDHPKATTIALGPTPEWTPGRKGEIAWNDATLCFQFWQSCASCHPDTRVDALNWDLLNDGLGNPKNAKSLFQSLQTPPAMWLGVRKTSSVAIRTGFQYILFAIPNEETCTNIEKHIEEMVPLKSPRLVNGQLSESAKRGKILFESKRVNCIECHKGEYFTDMKLHDVGTKAEFDRRADFDTPGLVEAWRTAPYMHDGRYVKMRDVFAVGKHGETSGDVSGLSEKEIDDLTEYVLSL